MIKTPKEYNHGFDLTGFDSDTDWVTVLNAAGINNHAVHEGEESWIWKGNGIVIFTSNDPLTGKYFRGNRGDEIGYAGYIGLTGDEDKVMAAVNTIKKLSDPKDESVGSRDFI